MMLGGPPHAQVQGSGFRKKMAGSGGWGLEKGYRSHVRIENHEWTRMDTNIRKEVALTYGFSRGRLFSIRELPA